MIKFEHVEPRDIERRSMEIIREELSRRGARLPETEAPVIERCIHTSADFDYYENLVFSANAVERMRAALSAGAVIVTDTEMAKAGISKVTTAKYGCEIRCFMSDPEVAEEAKKRGVTRATVSMEHAAILAKQLPNIILAIGNAPTALIELERLIREENLRPAGIIAVPVGFVNVVEAKELIWELRNSEEYQDIPLIVARGRKGGSNIAAAIVNALLYGIID
ncbi:MAG: precorrin-8X methylmutase [Oribacterium sp.]|nr:precorrin-8X methylmutase [Oribacterium sp.]